MLLLPSSPDHHRHARRHSSALHCSRVSPHMDAATLRSLALRGGGYSTPRLNDSLHANAAGLVGFSVSTATTTEDDEEGGEEEERENECASSSPLAAYSSLKSLHLSDNGFETLRGMPRLGELKCLFIERNCLTSLEGLSRAAPSLSTLDAGGNRLTSVSVSASDVVEGEEKKEKLGCLPRTLTTLRLSGNDFSAPGALDGLFVREKENKGEGDAADAAADDEKSGGNDSDKTPPPPPPPPPSSLLPHLSTLDLSHCSITDSETVLSLIEFLPSLRALYLQGNPFWDEMRIGRSGSRGSGSRSGRGSSKVGARLAVLAAAPLCTYLNDCPVFGDERAAADAFRASGGCAAAAAAAREAFLDAAAAEAEKTTRLLERPPRFLAVEECREEGEGDEERDEEVEVSGDENEESNDEEIKARKGGGG